MKMCPSQTSTSIAIERIVFAAEAIVCVRRADQAAIQAVGPPVIAALDSPGKMSLGAAHRYAYRGAGRR